MKNIAIVGGGTAGWLAALYAQKIYSDSKITLIESESVGILGAGEGSTPQIIDIMDFLDINLDDLIKECKVSIKNGIKFTNWSSKIKDYFHPFGSTHPGSNDYNFYLNTFLEQDTSFSHIFSTTLNHNIEDYSFMQKISYENKVPFYSDVDFNNNLNQQSIAGFSLHFDASRLAKYLNSVGKKRGVVRKEGIVEKIIADQNGYIKELITDKEKIEVDFVFDCTGFHRLIIGKFYKTRWVSHKSNLPANSAIPFFLPPKKNIEPFTESLAMDYGWMWKIPLQHRYGCGYVFDDSTASPENIKKEIDDFFGFEVESPKTFKFEAGFYEKIWVNNCLAVGLAAGFVEPLEATSIMQTILTLKNFFSLYGSIETKNENTKENFNKKYYSETKEIVDFLYLHYVTDKKNTKFWKNFTKDNDMPDRVKYILDVIKERPLASNIDFDNYGSIFTLSSFFYILIGNNIITKEMLQKYYHLMKIDKQRNYFNIMNNQKSTLPNLISHKDFLEKGLNI